tara:strand:+ start:208 stop:810 length:603 start_codon:yes stop_codon:yes gene_type:complete
MPFPPSFGSRLLCCKKAPQNEYKKLDHKAGGVEDIEAGGGDDDDEWQDFETEGEKSLVERLREQKIRERERELREEAQARERADSSAGQAGAQTDPEAEPELDPFADMGMAPVINKTKRHVASNPWAPTAPTSSSLAMTMDDDVAGDGGWDDDADGLEQDLRAERRKLAEERVRAGRERKRPPSEKPTRLAATRAPVDAL